ncbi:MAG: ATP phosphoribosyltransferase regulatory subunit [Anaerolineae bacterium]|nr:ATP phosphoribosyltransferase regulatory subunit [Anaerolineae bacterium]
MAKRLHCIISAEHNHIQLHLHLFCNLKARYDDDLLSIAYQIRFKVLPIQSPRNKNEIKGRRTNWVLAEINQHMRLYGYELIGLPIIDSADLFLVKAGDQIINSLFTFDRQGKQLALRPEFTASAADYFAKTQGSSIARWQFAGSVFEDKSHEFSTEFEQLGIGAELIGLSGSLAEAEIIAMSASGLDKVGIQDVHITIGHVGLIREVIQPFQLDSRTQRFLLHHIPAFNEADKGIEWILERFDSQFAAENNSASYDALYSNDNFASGISSPPSDSLGTMGGRTQEDILRRMKLKQQRFADRNNVVASAEQLKRLCQLSGDATSTLADLAELVAGNAKAVRLVEEWRDVISLLEAHGIALSTITIKPDLARSWEYYTGIVFELHSSDIHLGGGGRYDELARLVGSNVDTPSVGFAYYGNRLIDALQNIPNEYDEPIMRITCGKKDVVSATKWAESIRSRGIPVQILPYLVSDTNDKFEIYVENSTTVRFQTALYQIEQLDLLIGELKQFSK